MSALPQDQLSHAREFYRERIRLAFRHSRQFSQPLGTVPEAIVDSPAFDAVLRDCAVGSLDGARRLGEMVVVEMDRVPAAAGTGVARPGPWWRDLLNYERGCFLQEATTAEGPPTNRPRRGVCALCMNFSWDVPEAIARLKDGEPVSDDLRRPVTLLFARGREGRVHVVEVGAAVEKVFRATNGQRTPEQIAATAGVSVAETGEILEAMAGIGAVALAMTPEQMMRLIEQREKR